LTQKITLFSLLSTLFFSSILSHAEEKNTPYLLNLGVGIFDITKDPHNLLLQVEFRSFIKNFPYARPLFGIMGTDKCSFYVYGGMALDIFLGKHVVLTPSFAPGIYEKGWGKNLRFPIEFRSSIEVAYIFANQRRIGAQFYHVSNASFADKNPGAEALVFFYSIPFFPKQKAKA
jgi:hypothetical protein